LLEVTEQDHPVGERQGAGRKVEVDPGRVAPAVGPAVREDTGVGQAQRGAPGGEAAGHEGTVQRGLAVRGGRRAAPSRGGRARPPGRGGKSERENRYSVSTANQGLSSSAVRVSAGRPRNRPAASCCTPR